MTGLDEGGRPNDAQEGGWCRNLRARQARVGGAGASAARPWPYNPGLMDADRCPACARSFTPGEVTGLGILRSRPATAGGPYLDFPCPGCGRRLHLIPHGDGRYAPPGEPPPPPAAPELRRPPWATGSGAAPAAEGPPATPPPRTRTRTGAPPPPRTPPPRTPPGPAAPIGRLSALDQARRVLGVGAEAGAERIEQAYRERSLACHPDKVAHLDPDFQALAERKFRELKAAYDLLRGPEARG